MLVDGEASDTCTVISGVPQGNALGLILYLLFINDLPSVINNPCKLFADDLVVYCDIKSEVDAATLQEDMNRLADWERTCGMKFHLDKCETVMITRKRKPIQTMYTLRGQGLHKVSKAKYLGVTISSSLEWNTHIINSVKKANKTLGFLKRNLKGTHEDF